jgi:NADH:ubiquinone oxidoreductase subunit 3 (subunit A)
MDYDRSTDFFFTQGSIFSKNFFFDIHHNSYFTEYKTFFYIFIFSFFFVILISVISRIYPENSSFFFNFEQLSSYECGFAPFGVIDKPQLFLFYKLAVFFIIFEAELIFIYP